MTRRLDREATGRERAWLGHPSGSMKAILGFAVKPGSIAYWPGGLRQSAKPLQASVSSRLKWDNVNYLKIGEVC